MHLFIYSTEVPNATWCELEGLIRMVAFFLGNELEIKVLISDRNRQIAKWV